MHVHVFWRTCVGSQTVLMWTTLAIKAILIIVWALFVYVCLGPTGNRLAKKVVGRVGRALEKAMQEAEEKADD